ncbi:D-glucuronyl C5-epimerase family protein [Plantactinospora sp. WMMB782]|uniref:D-glucuronyl C5-epimerase family protein n=1 Tax=Plantactinospora sp. WMMB782 TaxID=3404121 RepID=UPI003B95683B
MAEQGPAGAPAAGVTSSSSAVRGIPFDFRYHPFEIRDLPDEIRPYHLRLAVPLEDTGPHDESGVRMSLRGGELHDHPVAQAQYGLNLIEAHRITGNAAYLERAVKQAQRLVDKRVEHEGGWFFPYPFRFVLHRDKEVYDPPWYSMMAQGQALSLFCRLHRLTGAGNWLAAAHRAFASYLVPPVVGHPWGVYVVDGRLWLEEYASPERISGDLTYNGHNFALFGLWDHWVLTRDVRTKVLLQGALTTMRDVYADIRRRHWRSRYCLRHGSESNTYHTIHTTQHIQCYAMTGDTIFAKVAELYYTDFPPHGVTGTVELRPGRHTGYRFDGTGKITHRRKLDLREPGTARSGARRKIRRQEGIWYEITEGALAGYHIQEIERHSYQRGEAATMGYRIPRPATVAQAAVNSCTVTPAGEMTSTSTDYRPGDPVNLDRRAVLNGVAHVRLADGPHAGRWLPYTAVDRL